MANGFSVSGVVKLVDDFSSKARTIAAQTTEMTSRFDRLKSRAGNLKAVLGGVAAAATAAFTVGKIKTFLQDAATEGVLGNKFEQMFAQYKDSLKIGRKELEQEISSLASLGGFDEDDIMGNVAAPMMRSGKLAGQNFLRAMQIAVNRGALEGNTAEALQQSGQKIAAMLINPRRGIMAAARDGIFTPKEQKELQKLSLNSKNMPMIQDRILKGYERMYGGAAIRTKNSPARTLAEINVGLGELSSGIGHVINAGFGKWLQESFLKVKAVGTSLADLSVELNKVGTVSEKLQILWDMFSKGTFEAKALAVAGVGLALVVGITLVGAIVSLAGVFGLLLAALGTAGFAAFVFKDELKALWESSDLVKAGVIALATAMTTLLIPTLVKVAGVLAPFLMYAGALLALGTLAASFGLLGEGAKSFVDNLQASNPVLDKVIGSLKIVGAALTLLAAKAAVVAIYTAAMALGPLLIPAAIIAAIAAVVYFWDEIKAAGSKALDYLSEKIKSGWDSLTDSRVVEWVKNLGNILYEALTAPFKAVGSLLSNLNIGDKIKGVGNSIMNFVGLSSDVPALPAAPSPALPSGIKATSDTRVSGEVNINIKDPNNRTNTSIVSTGDVPLNRGQTSSGSYRSTIPSLVGR